MKNGGLTANLVESRLREHRGNMAAVARSFGVSRQAVWDFVNRREKLKAVAVDVRESMKDDAESSLQTAVLEGEAWAVCFYLKTQAKDRGYTELNKMALTDPSGDKEFSGGLTDAQRLAALHAIVASVQAGGVGPDRGPAGNADGPPVGGPEPNPDTGRDAP